MEFELLPDEILIECFRYLNATDMFYSFDRLNRRFHTLIQNIPLNVSFENIQKSTFDQFCLTISSLPQIKNHIISLKLSDEGTCGQIDKFLSLFSLEEFPNLQSLTINGLKENTIEILESVVPSMSQLRYFCSIDWDDDCSSIILLPNLRTLKVNRLFVDDDHLHKTMSLVNLTINECRFNEICEILPVIPMIKYLNVSIKYLYEDEDDRTNFEAYSNYNKAIHLQKIVFPVFEGTFQRLKCFIKQTPNLKSLTISTDDKTMIDAYGWQDLITSLLPDLHIFNFIFRCYENAYDKSILWNFKQFQSGFWKEQHHWYTQYVLNKYSIYIYTIPYTLTTYNLTPYVNISYNKEMDNIDKFKNVKEVILDQKVIQEKCKFYFGNIESLKLTNESSISSRFHVSSGDRQYEANGKRLIASYYAHAAAANPLNKTVNKSNEEHLLCGKHIRHLKTIVNLDKLQHLSISLDCHMNIGRVLYKILKQSPQLTSLVIDPVMLIEVYDDSDACEYLNKMIKKLDIRYENIPFPVRFYVTEKFCRVFSNVEYLKCRVRRGDELSLLFTHLSKLRSLFVFAPCPEEHFYHLYKEKISNPNVLYDLQFEDDDGWEGAAFISMWLK